MKQYLLNILSVLMILLGLWLIYYGIQKHLQEDALREGLYRKAIQIVTEKSKGDTHGTYRNNHRGG